MSTWPPRPARPSTGLPPSTPIYDWFFKYWAIDNFFQLGADWDIGRLLRLYGLLPIVRNTHAGLSSIPTSIHEAAEIDRASRWTAFTRITLPLCAPLLGLAVLLRATDALKQFDIVMAIHGPNDPSTQTLSTLLYQVVFRDGKVGLGSAYACTVLVVVVALATVFTRYVDRMREKGLAR